MSGQPSDLSGTVRALRPFVPAKNFEISKRFYSDVGFTIKPLGDALAEMHVGTHSFLLQDYYVEQWAGNFVMHMLVDDVNGWWAHSLARPYIALWRRTSTSAKARKLGFERGTYLIRREFSGISRQYHSLDQYERRDATRTELPPVSTWAA